MRTEKRRPTPYLASLWWAIGMLVVSGIPSQVYAQTTDTGDQPTPAVAQAGKLVVGDTCRLTTTIRFLRKPAGPKGQRVKWGTIFKVDQVIDGKWAKLLHGKGKVGFLPIAIATKWCERQQTETQGAAQSRTVTTGDQTTETPDTTTTTESGDETQEVPDGETESTANAIEAEEAEQPKLDETTQEMPWEATESPAGVDEAEEAEQPEPGETTHVMPWEATESPSSATDEEGNESAEEPAATTESSADAEPEDAKATGSTEVMDVIGRAPAGLAQFVDELYLERYEHDDVLKVLAAVPGVYIRQEDGYGLRPNIGMRGSGSERSAKIALMMDGILFAPAPYTAPAAYFFPIMTKMVGMEVIKGPSGIRYGPNTVGGSLNLMMRPMPEDFELGLDIAGGTDWYGKFHAYYGDSTEYFGWLVEYVKLRIDGFKKLDNGGPTGFDKNDFTIRFRFNNSRSASISNELEVLLGVSNEVSHETYLGLTTDDFYANPYRRYAASQMDLLNWEHYQARMTYTLSTPDFDIKSIGYGHFFHRDWDKLNRFNDKDEDYSLNVITFNPVGGSIPFYQVLSGQADTASISQLLMVGSNDRWFISTGLELKFITEQFWFDWRHSIEIGTRLHFDSADRYHTEDPYEMRGGTMVRGSGATEVLMDAYDSTLAWASHYQHEARWGPLTITAGVRGELISTVHKGFQLDIIDVTLPEKTNLYFVLLPGGGVIYRPFPELEIFGGIHRGFVPNSPTQGGDVPPEMNAAYEWGARFNSSRISWFLRNVSVEMIGFFSDFSNLIGTCRISSGCSADRVGLEFSGGSVHSYGFEFKAAGDIPIVDVPVLGTIHVATSVGYTFQESVFRTPFVSANPQWSVIEVGYRMPYIPEHQLYTSLGLRGTHWAVEGYFHYTGAMRDLASKGELGIPTDPTYVVNAAAHYEGPPGWGKLYLTIENLIDQPYIVSRRPMGSRPGVPRRITVGYKNSF